MNKKLIIERTFEIPKAELWQWLTTNEKLTQWYGEHFIDEQGQRSLRMKQEEGQPIAPFKLLSCRPEECLELEAGEGEQTFRYDLTLTPVEKGTSLVLTHEVPEEMAEMFRMGWVFYYDCLEAAIQGKELPTWQG